jgi:hypothetical protein
VVVDCRPVERRGPRDIAKFEVTARACAVAGWEYRLLGAADALVTANLRSLAGYRHPATICLGRSRCCGVCSQIQCR